MQSPKCTTSKGTSRVKQKVIFGGGVEDSTTAAGSTTMAHQVHKKLSSMNNDLTGLTMPTDITENSSNGGFGLLSYQLAAVNRNTVTAATQLRRTEMGENKQCVRSHLDEITQSFSAPSAILQPTNVDFEASVMRLSDNDERLCQQVMKALAAQKQVFQKKLEKYAAVERNFEILKKVSLQQQTDFHAAMQHSNSVQKQNEALSRENKKLEGVNYRSSRELDTLRKKEMEFDHALVERLERQHELDALTLERNKLLIQIERLQANNQVLESECKVIKLEIIEEKRISEETRQRELQKIQYMEKLQGNIDDLQKEITEHKATILSQGNQFTIIDMKNKKTASDLADREEEVSELTQERDTLQIQLNQKTKQADTLTGKKKELEEKNEKRKQALTDLKSIYNEMQSEYKIYKHQSEETMTTNDRKINELEHNVQKLTKALTQARTKVDQLDQKGMDSVSQFNADLSKLKEELSNAHEQIEELTDSVTNLNETLDRTQSDFEAQISDLNAENEANMQELKRDLKAQMISNSELQMELDTAEASLDKERGFALSASNKLEHASSTLHKTESELRKLNDSYYKTQKKLDSKEQKLKSLEQNMNGAIEERIGDIMKQREAMDLHVKEVKQQLSDKEQMIEKMRASLVKRKQEHDADKEEHQKDIRALDLSKLKLKKMDEKLQISFQQNNEKLVEMDKLFSETEFLRDQLSKIRSKYDFDQIDNTKLALSGYESWANKADHAMGAVAALFESSFNCGLCSALAIDVVVNEPCNHVFCQRCVENQPQTLRCPSCSEFKEKSYSSQMITEFIENFKETNRELDRLQEQLKKHETEVQDRSSAIR